MRKARATALGLFLAGIVSLAAAPAEAGALPASIGGIKASAPTDVAQARWVGGWRGAGWRGGWGWRGAGWRGAGWGWRGGGWGWRRGWGFPGAVVGGLALGAAVAAAPSYYDSYNYYNPGIPYCDPYTYCGGPYVGGYRAAYWGGGPVWGWRRWGWGW
jgi:hypothetical protein